MIRAFPESLRDYFASKRPGKASDDSDTGSEDACEDSLGFVMKLAALSAGEIEFGAGAGSSGHVGGNPAHRSG